MILIISTLSMLSFTLPFVPIYYMLRSKLFNVMSVVRENKGCLQILVFHYDKILPIKFISPKLELFGSIRIGEIGWKEVGKGGWVGWKLRWGRRMRETVLER